MWEDREAAHVRKDMLKNQIWQKSYIGDLSQGALAHTVYICCIFRFDASPKKLFVTCNYYVLFLYLAAMVFKVNSLSIQYSSIVLDIQIMQDLHCTAVLTIIFFRGYPHKKISEILP